MGSCFVEYLFYGCVMGIIWFSIGVVCCIVGRRCYVGWRLLVYVFYVWVVGCVVVGIVRVRLVLF